MFPKSNPSPFRGKPYTKETKDKAGAPVFTISARAPSPLVVKTAHRLGLVLGFTVAGLEAVWAVATLPVLQPAAWVAMATAPFVAPFAVKLSLTQMLQSERSIRISTGHVEVSTLTGWKRFDLNLPVRATLIDHDKDKSEAERVEYINRKWGRRYWWFPMFRRYLNKSCHLSIDHLDQRNDIMTIYGRTSASRIAARINACIDVVRSHGRTGQGAVFEGKDDWSRQPGDIIDLD